MAHFVEKIRSRRPGCGSEWLTFLLCLYAAWPLLAFPRVCVQLENCRDILRHAPGMVLVLSCPCPAVLHVTRGDEDARIPLHFGQVLFVSAGSILSLRTVSVYLTFRLQSPPTVHVGSGALYQAVLQQGRGALLTAVLTTRPASSSIKIQLKVGPLP